MRTQKQFLLSAVTVGVLTLINQSAALAQSADAAPAAQPKDGVAAEMQTIVVTGTASGKGVRKIDSSFSITTANEAQIREAAPSSTADLLKIVPGLFAETTGGASGANIQIRGFPSGGDAPFVTIQMNGSPLFPPPTLSFLENSSLFRLDDSVERVEVLRGGPSPIYSNGQPGATMNFILKKGSEVNEGSLRATVGNGSMRRVDGFFGGKIADGWYGTVSGFYRTSKGIKHTEFAADKGGQIGGSITRKLDGGELTVYGRLTDDKNAFFTPVPLHTPDNGRTVQAFKGFDPLTGALAGNETRDIRVDLGNGKVMQRDLADGRGIKVNVFGADYEQKVGGWNISNKFNHLGGDANTLAIFTGAAPTTMAAQMSAFISSANTAGNGVQAAAGGVPATSGTATYVNGGGTVDPNQQVLGAGSWVVDKKISSTTDEFRISRELIPNHTVTAGAYFADYSSKDTWYLGNVALMTATPNARLIDVKLNNGALMTNRGQYQGAFFAVSGDYDGNNRALFLADEWKISERVKVDAGVRRERQKVVAAVEAGPAGIDTDNNKLTVYNNTNQVLTGVKKPIKQSDSASAYTIGGNLKISNDFGIFARMNSGYAMPNFDTMRDQIGTGRPAVVVKIKQYEIGLKTVAPSYSAYLTIFHNNFTGLQFSQFLANGTQTNDIGGSSANGVEFEAAVRPVRNLQIALTGNWQDGKYEGFEGVNNRANNGNIVQRQPKLQFRLTPSYKIPTGWGSVKLYSTYTHVGERFADIQNTQRLPKYHTLDAGILALVGDKLEFRLSGTNLSNQLGITEGNVSVIGAGTNAAGDFMGRPIFGRTLEASMMYRF
ncbi:MAG: TonB-dependent receptor [Pseudomonadota bacterium]